MRLDCWWTPLAARPLPSSLPRHPRVTRAVAAVADSNTSSRKGVGTLVYRVRRGSLSGMWALFLSWFVHWLFWPAITWAAFMLSPAIGGLVLLITSLWLLLLLFFAVRYWFVGLGVS